MRGAPACPDCGCAKGDLHDWFCTQEICPFCHGQMSSCRCIHSVLRLSTDESRAVEQFMDDSVEPLKTIVARWKAALSGKGRISFGGR
jgi:hypothetical protein